MRTQTMLNHPTAYRKIPGALRAGALTTGLILYPLLAGFAQPAPITTINARGAGTCTGQGTFVVNINELGVAVGYYVDANSVYHGFRRAQNGIVTTIDAPGAGAVSSSGQGTVAYSVNIAGVIAGQYQDAKYVYHGFLRNPDGRFVTFDAPRAGTGSHQGTVAVHINPEGDIAGFTQDDHNVFHGFIRSSSGNFISFDAPNAGTGPFQGTVVTLESGFTSLGELIGWYFDSNNVAHSYERQPSGVIISFDPPDSLSSSFQIESSGEFVPAEQLDRVSALSNQPSECFAGWCVGCPISASFSPIGGVRYRIRLFTSVLIE
jgi:hypothetical protein